MAAFESHSEMKEKGMISSSVSDSYLRNNAYHKGFLSQANHFIQQGINYQQFGEFETAISMLKQEKGGSTMISDGANLSSSRKAKQRARNTGPNGLNLDMLASYCTGLSGSCDNGVAHGGNRGGGGGERTVVPGSKGQVKRIPTTANLPFEQMLTRTRAKATKRMSDMNLDKRSHQKAYTVQAALVKKDEIYTSVFEDIHMQHENLVSQDFLNVCLMQASIEMKLKR